MISWLWLIPTAFASASITALICVAVMKPGPRFNDDSEDYDYPEGFIDSDNYPGRYQGPRL